MALSDLNGKNGFKLIGENSGDHSGGATSIAGDINDDGVLDLLIGASLFKWGEWQELCYFRRRAFAVD